MFDLSFFKTVGDVLKDAGPSIVRFASKYEYKLELRRESHIPAKYIESTDRCMAPELIELQQYVRMTYMPYFGILLPVPASYKRSSVYTYASA